MQVYSELSLIQPMWDMANCMAASLQGVVLMYGNLRKCHPVCHVTDHVMSVLKGVHCTGIIN